MVAVASVNETLPSLSFLSSSGFLAIVPSTSARLTLYTSTEDLEGRIKKTAVNSTLSGNNITLNANNNINAAGVVVGFWQ
jgi:hypothetical protein